MFSNSSYSSLCFCSYFCSIILSSNSIYGLYPSFNKFFCFCFKSCNFSFLYSLSLCSLNSCSLCLFWSNSCFALISVIKSSVDCSYPNLWGFKAISLLFWSNSLGESGRSITSAAAEAAFFFRACSFLASSAACFSSQDSFLASGFRLGSNFETPGDFYYDKRDEGPDDLSCEEGIESSYFL